MTAAVAVPPGPVPVAVYVVLADGVTDCVPPLACRSYELPSDPLIVTCVALVAATVNVDELPATTVVGFPAMVTVGAGFDVTVTVAFADAVPPGPDAAAV